MGYKLLPLIQIALAECSVEQIRSRHARPSLLTLALQWMESRKALPISADLTPLEQTMGHSSARLQYQGFREYTLLQINGWLYGSHG